MAKTILLIEDDLPTIEIYKTALKKANFGVEVIMLGEEAIKRIEEIDGGRAKCPDLILLDLILPDINGLEVLKEIRKHKKARAIPVFILSNYTDRELEERGLRLKTEKYLLKTDYPPRKLVKIIKEKLKRKK